MKRVIVCGASSGIGRSTALALAAPDVELVLAARRRQLLEGLAAECEAKGARTVVHASDVTQFTDCEELVRTASAMPGECQPVLVNSAGVADFGDFASSDVTNLESQIRTNLIGPLFACRAFVPWALQVGSGQVVNVLSIAAAMALPGAAVYSASKAGVLMLGKTLAAEYRKQGLRVTNILPGATDTPIWEGKEFIPPREDMLSVVAVAEAIRDIVLMPEDRNVDELVLMPPKGIL